MLTTGCFHAAGCNRLPDVLLRDLLYRWEIIYTHVLVAHRPGRSFIQLTAVFFILHTISTGAIGSKFACINPTDQPVRNCAENNFNDYFNLGLR